MGELVASMRSASWWFTAVFVSLLINLAAAYLKPALDQWRGRYSERRRARNATQHERFEAAVSALADNTEARAHLRYRVTSYQLWLLLLLFAFSGSMRLLGFVIDAIGLRPESTLNLLIVFAVGLVPLLFATLVVWTFDAVIASSDLADASAGRLRASVRVPNLD